MREEEPITVVCPREACQFGGLQVGRQVDPEPGNVIGTFPASAQELDPNCPKEPEML